MLCRLCNYCSTSGAIRLAFDLLPLASSSCARTLLRVLETVLTALPISKQDEYNKTYIYSLPLGNG